MVGRKGRSGRRKTPAAIKAARGTLRADRDTDAVLVDPATGEGGVPVGPAKPDHLHEIADREWDRLTPLALRCGLLTPLDYLSWRLGFWAISAWAEMVDRIGEPVHYTDKGNPIPRPEVYMAAQNWKAVKEWCREFGLTPSSRNGLRITLDLAPPRKATADPLDEMLNQG